MTCPDLQLDVALGKLGDGTMLSMVNTLSLGRVDIPVKQESHRIGAVTQQGRVWHAWHGVHLAGTELSFQSVTGKEIQTRWVGMGT